MKWKRSTVNADRTFTIPCPFFVAAGALRIEDVLDLYVNSLQVASSKVLKFSSP